MLYKSADLFEEKENTKDVSGSNYDYIVEQQIRNMLWIQDLASKNNLRAIQRSSNTLTKSMSKRQPHIFL